ncbi:MAG: RNA polymerase sigma factor [Acidimicrobiia bacterium]|nr:RNA polymerase sigma factor [Acidimicrobiia bacterium]
MDQSEFISILDAARAGTEWAWSRLYADLAGPVRGYAIARGAVEPDDVVGETFLQVARNLAGFEGEYSGFRSWVFVVAHHRIIDERRRRSRRPEDPVGESPTRAMGDVEQEAMDEIATERVMGVLAALTPDQRSVVMLRVVEDLSLEETAEILGKRVGAVKSLQKRAFDRLEKILPGAYPEMADRR